MLGPVELNNSLHTQFARAQAFLPKQMLGFLAILKFLFEEILVWCTRPAEIYFRWKFGVRGHSLFQTIQICGIGGFVGWTFAYYDLVLAGFCLASAVLAVYHRIEAMRWEMYGSRPRFSYSNGEPVPVWFWLARLIKTLGLNPDRVLTVSLISRFYEPLLVLAIGFSLRPVSVALGYYLICCSVALFIKGVIVHQRLITLKRDQTDARIMSQWLVAVQRSAAQQGDEEFFIVTLAAAPSANDGGDNGKPTSSAEQQPSSEKTIMAGDLLKFNCRKCNTEFHLHPKHTGKKGRCKKCGELNLVVATQPT